MKLPPHRRGTLGELIGLLGAAPSDIPILLVNEAHGCAGWLDGVVYDAEAHTVHLTAAEESRTEFVDLDAKYRTGTPASDRLVVETRRVMDRPPPRSDAHGGRLSGAPDQLRAIADDIEHTRALSAAILRLIAHDIEGEVCGDVRPWQGRLYVCDLPIGHADEVHQQSGGITWGRDGAIA